MNGGDALAARRALSRMALTDSVIAPIGGGRYGVFARGRKRETTQHKLSAETVRAWASNGAIIAGAEAGTYVLARAGAARAARNAAQPDEHYLAQHAAIETRTVMQRDGREKSVRAAADNLLPRLQRLRDARGEPWFSHDEVAAGLRLRADWSAGQRGLVRGSDWSAPPRGSASRGPSNAHETMMAAGADARQRVERVLAKLGAPLRKIVERACLLEQGLEDIEHAERWPPRSAKIALKCALAQLAEAYAGRA